MTQDQAQPVTAAGSSPSAPSRRRELLAFLALAFGIWPVVAVGVVGGYGFLVWMLQIVYGPPGPTGG
ncbi:MAG: periplasmic nitrate reductase, NapE protein [Rhizobiaceae bacterium]|nr:periplasmic nitrate reductase, NapE protein [Rhizobiaceae bacterium]